MIAWLLDPSHWTGSTGIPIRVVQHLAYSGITLLIAMVIGLPLGLYIGHTGRGRVVMAGIANALRALPTLGLLILGVLIISPLITSDLAFTLPCIIVLVILAIPPIMTNTFAGVDAVPDETKQAGYGMGMTGRQVLWQVELPNALPLIVAGIRSSALQVIATATVAAYVSLGGLGRYLIDGLATQDYVQMASGSLLVVILAILVELALVGVQMLIVSPGVSARKLRLTNARAARTAASADTASGQGSDAASGPGSGSASGPGTPKSSDPSMAHR